MNDWNDFLKSRKANNLLDVGAQGARVNDSTCLIDLSHQGLLGIEGPDAAKFLQGQVTCDVRELGSQVTRLGAQCTLKGRMLISFRALQLDAGQIFLRMHRGLVEKAMGTFGKYIVFSKAQLHDRSATYRRIGLSGPDAETRITHILGALPAAKDEYVIHEGNIIIKIDDRRYECWVMPDQAEQIWLALESAGCIIAEENIWTLLDVRAGIGEVRPETSEVFTPQSLNFQLVNGINFRKGCYTGQEIVARLHYRGILKQHMYRVGAMLPAGAQLPLPGTTVVNAEQRTIGEVVICAHSGPGTAEALAVISDAHLDDAYLAINPPQKLDQLPLPYAIPTEEKS